MGNALAPEPKARSVRALARRTSRCEAARCSCLLYLSLALAPGTRRVGLLQVALDVCSDDVVNPAIYAEVGDDAEGISITIITATDDGIVGIANLAYAEVVAIVPKDYLYNVECLHNGYSIGSSMFNHRDQLVGRR